MGCMIGLMFVTCQYPYAGVALITIGLAFRFADSNFTI